MYEYLDIVKHVLENGKIKKPVRKCSITHKWTEVDGGISTLACANVLFSHNMEDGFPLLTTKKMAWKSICVELEGFIRGITDKRWFQDRGCKIWNEWANPVEVYNTATEQWESLSEISKSAWRTDDDNDLDGPTNKYIKAIQEKINDLGAIYGHQWRMFDQHYCTNKVDYYDEYKEDPNGVFVGADQLRTIVDTLLTNPMDRRMVCSAWNPNQIHLMALPPCHFVWNVTVIGDELNLFWAQRSCDLMLGVPFNIASYALLLKLLARTARFKPGNLSGMLVDCHIYENQIDAAEIQVTRTPRPLPNIELKDNSGELHKVFNIFDWTYKDVDLLDYNPLDSIDFGAVTV